MVGGLTTWESTSTRVSNSKYILLVSFSYTDLRPRSQSSAERVDDVQDTEEVPNSNSELAQIPIVKIFTSISY